MKTKNEPVIIPVNEAGDFRTASVVDLSVSDIEKRLGFTANCEDDPSKVKHSWGFTVDGERCGVWDYKGSEAFQLLLRVGPYLRTQEGLRRLRQFVIDFV